ncbi:hypothetical protein NDN08_007321 [Rhodosorus marinus]|uniref:Uncharacterized protein n=1 Tax=Rhodosorus marinus TaxID=101924 RepID=A0AAV8UG54_9RHOD|nr:hypothetical protein NDN08_007321 [Rhodosorus marinus]
MTIKFAKLFWWTLALCAMVGFSPDAAAIPCRHGSCSRAPKLIPSTRQVDCEGVGVLPENVQLKNVHGVEENCAKVGDLSELPSNFAEIALKDAGSSSSAVDLLNNIFDPLETALKVALQSLTGTVNDNICFGNFKGSEFKEEINIEQDPMHFSKCKELPVLQDAEWSAFGFAVTVPFPGCFSTTGTMAFCAAVSICPETKLPSVAVVINAETLECMGENLRTASTGFTASASIVISLGLDFISWGISLSNSLVANVNVYTGHPDRYFKFVGYEVRGNYQDSMGGKLNLEKFNGPPVLGLTGDHKRIVSVRGVENVQFENLISFFMPDDDGDILDVFESLQDVSIQGTIIIKLQLNFKFSEVKALCKVLPDSGAITIGKENLFFTTGSATPPGEEYADLVVKPGFYGLIGSNADISPAQFDKFNCPGQKLIKVTMRYVLGIKVSKKKKTVGQTSQESCLKSRLEEARMVVATFNGTAEAETNYTNTLNANRDAVFGAKLTKQEIPDSAELVCSRDIRRDQVEAGKLTIPVTVTCSAKKIGDAGPSPGRLSQPLRPRRSTCTAPRLVGT